MQVNIQGVERDLRRIEQIDSRLYNNEGSKYTNEQQQLRKLFFFSWEDAVVQNLIPDDIFLIKFENSREFDTIRTSGDGNCHYRSASLILVFMKQKH